MEHIDQRYESFEKLRADFKQLHTPFQSAFLKKLKEKPYYHADMKTIEQVRVLLLCVVLLDVCVVCVCFFWRPVWVMRPGGNAPSAHSALTSHEGKAGTFTLTATIFDIHHGYLSSRVLSCLVVHLQALLG